MTDNHGILRKPAKTACPNLGYIPFLESCHEYFKCESGYQGTRKSSSASYDIKVINQAYNIYMKYIHTSDSFAAGYAI
jgi:hypothetical protein